MQYKYIDHKIYLVMLADRPPLPRIGFLSYGMIYHLIEI